ncbi:MAG: DUF1287 domain-containing protein [Bacteroidetes bacterium]|nr:DUF1287 domain-containing protein [Bacteroidota bacterium]
MKILNILLTVLLLSNCTNSSTEAQNIEVQQTISTVEFFPQNFADSLSVAALSIVNPDIIYDGRYFDMEYPMGDIPTEYGVCTDVIIRTYRKMGIDLQQELHEDIKSNRNNYQNIRNIDYKIDHRRVPNLSIFFTKYGEVLEISNSASDYKAGDIIYWKLGGRIDHIGLVTHLKSENGTPLIVHNIGSGQLLEDCLFNFPIYKHFSYRKE